MVKKLEEEQGSEIERLRRQVGLLERQRAAMDRFALVTRIDKNLKIAESNELYGSVFEEKRGEATGTEFTLSGRKASEFAGWKEIATAMGKGEPWSGQLWEDSRNGKRYCFEIHIVPLTVNSSQPEFLVIRNDITPLMEAEVKLLERNNELNTFIYKLSHDIRGPVASILGLLHLAGEELTNLTALRYLAMIRQRINRLDGVLRDLVETISVTERELVPETIRFAEIVDDVIAELDPEKELKMEFRKKFELREDYLNDSRILRPVFHHLIGNAIRYRDPGKGNCFIEISVGKMNGGIGITVEDNGIGMPAAVKDRVFEMFYRGSLQSSGAGLGLYIVKVAVEKLGGKARMDSREGVGSKVSIFLPALKAV